mmetsp:Transcript_44966/g.88705  ORF Transcript_44966/g.88705 Transcript_44966/m.88705 type:complete len:125 (+) Transcript_44966:204-578(+)
MAGREERRQENNESTHGSQHERRRAMVGGKRCIYDHDCCPSVKRNIGGQHRFYMVQRNHTSSSTSKAREEKNGNAKKRTAGQGGRQKIQVAGIIRDTKFRLTSCFNFCSSTESRSCRKSNQVCL